ncbi:MAG: hypothetical protein IPK85_21190 [Gemmatimonadetes bacterium]|nr:hypothetical protein [Gemmatimonadota bacterium]
MKARLGLFAVFAASGVLTGQVAAVRDLRCAGPCPPLQTSTSAVDFPDRFPLLGIPQVVASGTSGTFHVIQQKNALEEGPPLTFASSGRFLGALGGRGRGPGESEHPQDIATNSADTTFLVEGARVTAFDGRHKPLWTKMLTKWIERPTSLTYLSAGEFAAIGTGPVPADSPRPIETISLESAARRPLITPSRLPESIGRLRLLSPARSRPGSVWVAQWGLVNSTGYLLYRAGPAVNDTVLLRDPPWWRRIDMSPAVPGSGPPISTRLVAIREVAPGILGILMGQPVDSLARRPIAARTGGGWWNRYETLLELVDVARATKIGEVRSRGFPRGFASDSAIVAYSEVDDEPALEIVRYRIPK